MKSKKGFTLIELLAVIVILAIIALIATPIVLNMINSARKSSAKSSTLGFIDSIEYYAGFHQANSGGDLGIDDYKKDIPTEICVIENKIWKTCSEFMTDVKTKTKGSAPTDGEIEMNTSGKVQAGAWMKYNGFICTYDGKDVECEYDGSSKSSSINEYKAYVPGNEILYNPVEGKSCNAVSGDCMRFYAIENSDNTKSTVNAILDHNTTAKVAWNTEYTNLEMKEVKTEVDKISMPINEGGLGWKSSLNPRLITADEIAKITRNETFSGATSTSDKEFYFDTNTSTMDSSINSAGKSKYAWLFDNTNGCEEYGCNTEGGKSEFGYWTSTKVFGSEDLAWRVLDDGGLSGYLVYEPNYYGVRPVITINK